MLLDALRASIFQPAVLITVIVSVFAILLAAVIQNLKKNNPNKVKDDHKLPYLLRKSVLTNAEFEFSKELAKYVPRDHMILAKVSLHDIFEVDKKAAGKDYLKYFNKYASKHVDFLVCDRVTFRPLYGVELDDSSHNTPSAITRDEFVNSLYEHTGLKLIHIKWRRDYKQDDFNEIIEYNNSMSEHQ